MILVTAIDKHGSVTFISPDADSAASVALRLAYPGTFLRIKDGAWSIVFPARAAPSVSRLAHIIEHRAEVEFA